MFTIKTTQKLLRTLGDPAQEMIDSQVMGLEAVHLMEKEALMEQDQLGLQAMALDQTVGILAAVLLTAPEAQATVVTGEQGMAQLVEVPQMAMVAVMEQGMAQLVAQVLVMETVLTVGIPALVLLMAPEVQVTAVTVEQGMVQVQATVTEQATAVTEQATAVTALTTVLSLTLLL